MYYRIAFSVLVVAPLCLAWNVTTEVEARRRLVEDKYNLAAFIAPDTDPTELLRAEWRNVERELQSTITIDCSKDKGLCQEFDVVSFPTIRFYSGKNPMIRYRGQRTSKSMLGFVKRINQPVVFEATSETVDEFSTSDNIVLVVTINVKDDPISILFKKLAEQYHDRYSFGVRYDRSSATSSVICYNNIDGAQHTITDFDNVAILNNLITSCTEPLIPQLTRRNEMKYFSTGKSLVYYFTDDEADRENYVGGMKETARQYAEFLTLVTVDSKEYPDMAMTLGVDGGRGLSVQNLHNGQIFPLREEQVTPEVVAAFIMAISEGKVVPWERAQATVTHDEL